MPIPLEDKFEDVINKAMRGLVRTDAMVAQAAGVEVASLQKLRAGTWEEATAQKVAPVLGLKADALVALANETATPAPIELPGLLQFNTPFDDMTVNSYLVWDAASGAAVAFDSGTDCSEMLAALEQRQLRLELILLTHTHGDHILELDRLREKTGAPAFVDAREPLEGAEPFADGRTFTAGALRIETRRTWGHSRGGVTYVVGGLERPVAIVGDALFASSMGGGMVSYEAALQTNRAEILTLADETILCPGHGPMTTVAREKIHNPFFP